MESDLYLGRNGDENPKLKRWINISFGLSLPLIFLWTYWFNCIFFPMIWVWAIMLIPGLIAGLLLWKKYALIFGYRTSLAGNWMYNLKLRLYMLFLVAMPVSNISITGLILLNRSIGANEVQTVSLTPFDIVQVENLKKGTFVTFKISYKDVVKEITLYHIGADGIRGKQVSYQMKKGGLGVWYFESWKIKP